MKNIKLNIKESSPLHKVIMSMPWGKECKVFTANRKWKSNLAKIEEFLSTLKCKQMFTHQLNKKDKIKESSRLVNVHYEQKVDIFSKNTHREVIDNLVAAGVIFENNAYCSGKTYNKVTKKMVSNGKDSFTMSYRIQPEYNNLASFEVCSKQFEGLEIDDYEIDVDAALAKLKEIRADREWSDCTYFSQVLKVLAFNTTDFEQSKATSKYGREFNKVNMTVSDIRPFITYKELETLELDYDSASLQFLYAAVAECDKEKYKAFLDEGDAYTTIHKHLYPKAKEIDRDKIKHKVTRWIGSNRDEQWSEITKFFDARFCNTLMKWDADESFNTCEFTQELESSVIVSRMAEFGASLHDGVLVLVNKANEARSEMERLLKEFLYCSKLAKAKLGIEADVDVKISANKEIEPMKEEETKRETAARLRKLKNEKYGNNFTEPTDQTVKTTNQMKREWGIVVDDNQIDWNVEGWDKILNSDVA